MKKQSETEELAEAINRGRKGALYFLLFVFLGFPAIIILMILIGPLL
jgi:hypothetical protein